MMWVLQKILGSYGLLIKVLAQGGGGTPTGGGGTPGGVTISLINPLACNDFSCVAQAIINALFYISIPLVTIMVLIGGFQILTATGDPEKFTKGRNTILYAVLGFAVIIIGLGAVSLIRQLLGA